TRWPRDWSSDVCSSDLELIDAVSRAARGVGTRTPPPTMRSPIRKRAGDGTPRRVLIVEDDQDGRDALKWLLELDGYTVDVAGSRSEERRVGQGWRSGEQ